MQNARGYYGTHMRVLQGLQDANDYHGTYMGVLQWMQNAYGYFLDLYAGIAYLKMALWSS